MKLETLQPTSSYKVRGAFNAVLRMAREHDGSFPQLDRRAEATRAFAMSVVRGLQLAKRNENRFLFARMAAARAARSIKPVVQAKPFNWMIRNVRV
jgi:hypothetical protein